MDIRCLPEAGVVEPSPEGRHGLQIDFTDDLKQVGPGHEAAALHACLVGLRGALQGGKPAAR